MSLIREPLQPPANKFTFQRTKTYIKEIREEPPNSSMADGSNYGGGVPSFHTNTIKKR